MWVKIIVCPWLANFFKIPRTLLALLLSNPEVGSSRIITEGFETISIAMQTLFFSPPEIPFTTLPPTKAFWHF